MKKTKHRQLFYAVIGGAVMLFLGVLGCTWGVANGNAAQLGSFTSDSGSVIKVPAPVIVNEGNDHTQLYNNF
ncbi:MAG: hypothetical protein LBR23_05165, partial [Spirochaetaceae bacterium]|nr:hypothetical protein [Spirochaetaceae bacterium]